MKPIYLIATITGLSLFSSASYSLLSASSFYVEPTMNSQPQQITSLRKDQSSLVIEVNQQDETNWYATNDGVMGGRSTGQMSFEQDFGIFSGNISLANNGGFSSVYRRVNQLEADTDAVVIDVEGDGNTYQLRLALNINGYRIPYKQNFETRAGVRQQISLSLAQFRASYHGRIISDAPPVYPERIKEVGFLLANKKAGAFSLVVHKIVFANNSVLETAAIEGR